MTDPIPSAIGIPSALAEALGLASPMEGDAGDAGEELDIINTEENNLMAPLVMPIVEGAGGLPISGSGVDASIKFQLIPYSEVPGKAAIGEVVERSLKENFVIKLGRQVVRDGQATIKGNKKATEQDIWFTSKVVSRLHAEIWTKDGQLCVKDVGSSSGTFLNQMRLSPSGKESRPYPLKQGDILQFGVDFKGKTEDVYRAINVKIGFHDQSWLKAQRKNANPQRFSAALKNLLAAINPYGDKKDEQLSDTDGTDCCICICPIAPFQALFIAPCSHCYHYKCVGYLVAQSPMFQCPLCRQVANLTASVSTESLSDSKKIIIPLPVLEDELPPLKTDNFFQQEVSPTNRPRGKPRGSSFTGAKKMMGNLGFLSPKSPTADMASKIPDPVDLSSPAVGAMSLSNQIPTAGVNINNPSSPPATSPATSPAISATPGPAGPVSITISEEITRTKRNSIIRFGFKNFGITTKEKKSVAEEAMSVPRTSGSNGQSNSSPHAPNNNIANTEEVKIKGNKNSQ